MPHRSALTSYVLTLALVAPACVTDDDLDARDRLAENLDLDDDELDDVEIDDADSPAAERELAAERPEDAVVGATCHRFDSNGPLPGGTITVSGCDAGETCSLYACGGYSCVGTCQAGGGWTPK